jgi:broad specificity phosphatase PhoE
MRANEVREYERAYDSAGILSECAPPAELIEVATNAEVLATSDLRRAVESARRLAAGRDLRIEPLLREVELELPQWIPIALPIAVWDAMSFAQWSYRLAFRIDHALVRRADMAADWLTQHAATSACVVAVTHGGFRRIIRARLEVRGWLCDKRDGYANWSAWTFSPPRRALPDQG